MPKMQTRQEYNFFDQNREEHLIPSSEQGDFLLFLMLTEN